MSRYQDAPRPPMILQSQGQWQNRSNPRIHGAFSELLGDSRLWVSFDGAAFTPPDNPPKYKDGEGFHWDLSQDLLAEAVAGTGIWSEGIPRVQGVLYLSDMPEDGTGGKFTSNLPLCGIH